MKYVCIYCSTEFNSYDRHPECPRCKKRQPKLGADTHIVVNNERNYFNISSEDTKTDKEHTEDVSKNV